ncbi:MFS transporter [Dermacoccus barathri]|uniref:MFS transporter n=1 Tax=Dermacoccus barathri TaxID=322601 RepID=UPI0031F98FD5
MRLEKEVVVGRRRTGVAILAATALVGSGHRADLASSMLTPGLGAFLAGMFCAPTMTASVDAVARVVPERVRGEAMGWRGSFLTTGGALGGPIAGWAIDSHGFAGGFAAVGGLGAPICVAGVLIVGGRRAQRSRSARRASAWVGE